jgi:hypothetical protein
MWGRGQGEEANRLLFSWLFSAISLLSSLLQAKIRQIPPDLSFDRLRTGSLAKGGIAPL